MKNSKVSKKGKADMSSKPSMMYGGAKKSTSSSKPTMKKGGAMKKK